MAKLGVDIEVETKPKIVPEKKKKAEVIPPTTTATTTTTQPLQALLEVVRPQIIKKEYPADEDEEIDILGEEGNESPTNPKAVDKSPAKKRSVGQDALTPIPSPIESNSTTTTTTTTSTTASTSLNNSIPLSSESAFHTADITDHNDAAQPHCTKCNHICNNCSNSTNINNNSNNNSNNNNNINNDNDFPDECDEEGGFESHIDCPTPTEEKVFDVDNVSPEETTGNREFFSGNTAKTPERYLKIRNTIVDQWLKHKPKYLSKTSVRTSLKDCGDVNAIGRVHDFLERMGAINFGADRPPRHRQPSSNIRTPFSSSSPLVSQPSTCSHTCSHALHPVEGDEVTGPRKRRVRTRTSDWGVEDDQPVTYEHKPGEDGLEYAHRFAALNAKYFVEDDDVKKRLPRKRTKYQSQDGESDEPLPYPNLPPCLLICFDSKCRYDPFRLIPCSRSLPPVVSTTTTPTSHSTSFTLSVQSTALVIMDTHAHMATTEVLGLLGGTYDTRTRHVHVACAVPCESMSSTVQCEMDPQSQVVAREGLEARGFIVVGWYHSHPAFAPCPSIRVSPYDPRHPSDVSLFNYIVVGDEWSLHHEYQLPYEVPRTIISDVLSPALFIQIAEIVNKYKSYKYRVDMNKMFRRGEKTTCLDKMLRSIAAHYFVSQGVSADEQALLINKIRNLFKSEKAEKSEKSERADGEKSDKSEYEKDTESKNASCSTTGKRKKDLLQLHQQQQQQRLQQTQQPLPTSAPQQPSPPHIQQTLLTPIPQSQPIFPLPQAISTPISVPLVSQQIPTTIPEQKPIKPQLLPLVHSQQVPIKIQQKQQRQQQVTTVSSHIQLNYVPQSSQQPTPNSSTPITVTHQSAPPPQLTQTNG